MTLNLVASDYASTRDFAIVDTAPKDVSAIDAVFSADWASTRITPSPGLDLLWSPGAESSLVGLIDDAHYSLFVESEEMADPYITAPLEAAARRGVRVEIVMTASSSWTSAFSALTKAGVVVRTYAEAAPLYIHAKAIVADEGTRYAKAFVGSQNFSITSLIHNRELGIVTHSSGVVSGLASVIAHDFAVARPWSG
jgi:phosphatidylserine/phosphatidylglycerophosphate/cardiolipin synthase-like enzyme